MVAAWLPSLEAALIAGATALLLVLAWRTKLQVTIALEGDLGTSLRLEAGLRWGLLGVRAYRPRGEPLRVELALVGVRLLSRSLTLAPRRRTPRKSRKHPAWKPRLRSLIDHYDLGDVAGFAWQRRRDFTFEGPGGWLVFGAEEPDCTGTLYGMLCALRALIPPTSTRGSTPGTRFEIEVDWSLRDRVAGRLDFGVGIRFVRLLMTSLGFLLSHYRRASRPSALHA